MSVKLKPNQRHICAPNFEYQKPRDKAPHPAVLKNSSRIPINAADRNKQNEKRNFLKPGTRPECVTKSISSVLFKVLSEFRYLHVYFLIIDLRLKSSKLFGALHSFGAASAEEFWRISTVAKKWQEAVGGAFKIQPDACQKKNLQ